MLGVRCIQVYGVAISDAVPLFHNQHGEIEMPYPSLLTDKFNVRPPFITAYARLE